MDEQESNAPAAGTKVPPASAVSVSQEPVVGAALTPPAMLLAQEQDTLPRSYGSSVVCLMPKSPQAFFAYWDFEWSLIFEEGATDRATFLRLLNSKDEQETEFEVEPLAGYADVVTPRPAETYYVELGFRDRVGQWRTVGKSAPVLAPADGVNEGTEADFANVPLHLSFEKIIEAWRAEKCEREALATISARVENEAGEPASDPIPMARTAESLASLSPKMVEGLLREHLTVASSSSPLSLQKRLERILGFGSTSPTSGLGGSSLS